jgi:hypothetical protein
MAAPDDGSLGVGRSMFDVGCFIVVFAPWLAGVESRRRFMTGFNWCNVRGRQRVLIIE